MRVLYESKRRVVVVSRNKIKVVNCAVQGPDAIPPDTYTSHMENTNNPHEVRLFQLLIPAGNDGQWLRFSDDGSELIATDPPLTEVPELPQPIDEKVKADSADPTAGFLNSKVAGVLRVDEVGHVVRLQGALDVSYPANYYYGTNDEGQLGFWPLPDSLVQESGIGAEDMDEWLNTGELAFFEWP